MLYIMFIPSYSCLRHKDNASFRFRQRFIGKVRFHLHSAEIDVK